MARSKTYKISFKLKSSGIKPTERKCGITNRLRTGYYIVQITCRLLMLQPIAIFKQKIMKLYDDWVESGKKSFTKGEILKSNQRE